MNPFFNVAQKVAAGDDLEAKSGLEWWSERGWNLITGRDGDHPKSFRDLVLVGLRQNPVVAACLRVLTSAIGEAPLHAYTETEDVDLEMSWTPLPRTHPAEELLEFPNERDSRVTLISRKTVHFLLAGNAFEHKIRNGAGLVEELRLIRPDKVMKAKLDDDDNVISYVVVVNAAGKTVDIPATDIIHTVDVDPLNEIFGMPRLLSASSELTADNAASQYVREILSNHGNPGLLIGVDPSTRKERITEAEADWEEKFGPGRGRGKVGFVPGATTVREIGFNLQQLEFPSLRNVTREGICAIFGIDPLYVGIGSAARGSTLSGAEQEEARKKLWSGTVVPLITLFESQLNRHLAVEFGDKIGIFFDITRVAALKEDRTEAVERAERMKNTGVFTFPEIRAEAGLPPDVDEEDMVMMPTGVIAVPARDLLNPPEEEEEEEETEEETELADYPRRHLHSGT